MMTHIYLDVKLLDCYSLDIEILEGERREAG
jgi:hypothetical protein